MVRELGRIEGREVTIRAWEVVCPKIIRLATNMAECNPIQDALAKLNCTTEFVTGTMHWESTIARQETLAKMSTKHLCNWT